MYIILKFFVFAILLYFLFLSKAYAYLDPGTGSIILQAIIGFLSAAAAVIVMYINKIKAFFSKIFKRKKIDDSNQDR